MYLCLQLTTLIQFCAIAFALSSQYYSADRSEHQSHALSTTKWQEPTNWANARINERFDGANFQMWKWFMKMILFERELWGAVSGEEVKPEGDALDARIVAYSRRDRKAYAAYLCLANIPAKQLQ
ncbi:hypothetical protein O6H91_11G019000 [Diphasiastrum complanatum]|uniref:Uncharacterized protein n=1 Tax=Diphasiastrum complanatum TaxID=34168 RepID=A0ACC2C715_DIPCM|nr:hypothetical protein O6H91_11G019000 [Diphasiastrum complanatum]